MNENIEEIKTAQEVSHMKQLVNQAKILQDIENADPFDKDALMKVCQNNNINQGYLYNHLDTKKKCMELHARRIQIIKDEYESGLYTNQDLATKHKLTQVTIKRLLKMCGFKNIDKGSLKSFSEKPSKNQIASKESNTRDIPASFRRQNNSIKWGQFLGFGKTSFSSLLNTGVFKDREDFYAKIEAKLNEYNVGETYRVWIKNNAGSIWYTMAKRAAWPNYMAEKTKNKVTSKGKKDPRWKTKSGRIFWGKFLGYGKKDSLNSLYLEGKIKNRDEFISIINNQCEEFGIRPKKMIKKAKQAWAATIWMAANEKIYHKAKICPTSDTSYESPVEPHNERSGSINMNEYEELKNDHTINMNEYDELKNDPELRMDSDEVIILKINENINMYISKKISARDVVNRMKELVK